MKTFSSGFPKHTSLIFAIRTLRHWRGVCVLFLVLASNFLVLSRATAQTTAPRIAYILPDIGTPNFNTYIEIFAPADARENFGPDGIYTNNADAPVRVVPARAADTAKVIISPLVVSWQGRLISCHVFVLPEKYGVRPNSTNWRSLNDAWVIPLKVIVRDATGALRESNTNNFYIVQPTPLGDLVGKNLGTVFGEGGLGVRSPRGAMIVDSLLLETAKTYTVSTQDCDPNTDGNQGYLPFVLLAKGKVIGRGSTIDVSAQGINGGPGGGGGGGRTCDGVFASPSQASNGGDGFAGGGAGGFNRAGFILAPNSRWQEGGMGSGVRVNSEDGAQSLTGVLGGRAIFPRTPPNPNAPESAGGGTGHPFGLSGYPSSADGNERATFGGGNGGQQTGQGLGARGENGYSASFATFGAGGRENLRSLAYGNKMAVPIAGGSGGGGGNPVGNCGGSGGGGGGAVNVYSLSIENMRLKADGADGQQLRSGDNGSWDGGAGSGGYVGVQCRSKIDNVFISVQGGRQNREQNLGYGRIRFDTPRKNFTGFLTPTTDRVPLAAYTHQGFLSDTASLAPSPITRPVTIRGFYQGPSIEENDLRTYRRSLTGQWLQRPDATRDGEIGEDGIVPWSVTDFILDALDSDSLYFYCFVGRRKQGSLNLSDPFAYTPEFYFSQAAVNILAVPPLPLISASAASLGFATNVCGTDRSAPATQATMSVFNNRGGTLYVTGATLQSLLRPPTSGPTGFSIASQISPVNPRIVLPPAPPASGAAGTTSSTQLVVQFQAPGTIMNSVALSDTLLIFHNDTIPDARIPAPFQQQRPNPIRIPLLAVVNYVDVRGLITGDNMAAPTMIDFGRVPVGQARQRSIVIRNTGNTVVRYRIDAAAVNAQSVPFSIPASALTGTMEIPLGGSLAIPVNFQPDIENMYAPRIVRVSLFGVGVCGDGTPNAQPALQSEITLAGTGILPRIDVARSRAETRTNLTISRCYPETATTTLTVRLFNLGSDSLRVSGITARVLESMPSGASVTTSATRNIGPNGDGASIVVNFVAPLTTQDTATYFVETLVPNNDTTGRGANNPWRTVFAVRVNTSVFTVSITPQGRAMPQLSAVNFGGMNYGLSVSTTLTITNTGNTVVVVSTQPALVPAGRPFTLVWPPASQFPRRLLPNDTMQVTVNTALTVDDLAVFPQDVEITGSLRLAFDLDQSQQRNFCSAFTQMLPVRLTPKSPPQMNAELVLDSISAAQAVDPRNETTLRIRGRLSPTSLIIPQTDTLLASIRIMRGLFAPRTVSAPTGTARIVEQRMDANGQDRLVRLSIPNVRLTRRDSLVTVAEITGYPLLGGTTASQLVWDVAGTGWAKGESSAYANFVVTNTNSPRPLRDGLLTLNACTEGGVPRLVVTGAVKLLTLAPNPVSDDAVASLFLPQQGEYTLTLTNALGSRITVASWRKTTPTPETVDIPLHSVLREAASGVYSLNFTTPEERQTIVMQVRK